MYIIWEDRKLVGIGFNIEERFGMKDIIIIGAGGFGRETVQLIDDINSNILQWNLLGFVDDKKEIQGKEINGYQVLGGIDFLNYYEEDVYIVSAIANCRTKKNIIEKLNNKNIRFANLIHPSAVVARDLKLGFDIIIQSNCVLTTNIRIGNHVGISPQCGLGHDCYIGDYCTLFWNVNIGGQVVVEEGCLLGTKTTIIQERRVGSWSIVGSNANIIRDIQDNCTAVGNPAEVIKFHNT